MRLSNQYQLALLMTIAAVFTTPAARAQDRQASAPHHAELALDYAYVRSNAPPGACTCFSLNGGSATFALPIKSSNFAFAADVTVAQASSISTSAETLTLSAFTAGVRYSPPFHHSPLKPFGQVLIGAAHASGTLVEGSNPASANAGAAFAANLGGGLDLRMSHHFSIRLAEADYLLTTFDNASNDHQNNLRISAGIVLRFGHD
jgi:outer membrane immunogenic protein